MNPTVDKENRQEPPPLSYVIPSVAEESAMPALFPPRIAGPFPFIPGFIPFILNIVEG